MPDESYWDTFFNPACMVARLDVPAWPVRWSSSAAGTARSAFTGRRLGRGPVPRRWTSSALVAATASRRRGRRATQRGRRGPGLRGGRCGVADGRAAYATLFNILHIENPGRAAPRGVPKAGPRRQGGDHPSAAPMSKPPRAAHADPPNGWSSAGRGANGRLEFVRYESLCCCSWHPGPSQGGPTRRRWSTRRRRANDSSPQASTGCTRT